MTRNDRAVERPYQRIYGHTTLGLRVAGVGMLLPAPVFVSAPGLTATAGRQATPRYAKRQYHWFAHQPPPDWSRFKEALHLDRLPEALALLRVAG